MQLWEGPPTKRAKTDDVAARGSMQNLPRAIQNMSSNWGMANAGTLPGMMGNPGMSSFPATPSVPSMPVAPSMSSMPTSMTGMTSVPAKMGMPGARPLSVPGRHAGFALPPTRALCPDQRSPAEVKEELLRQGIEIRGLTATPDLLLKLHETEAFVRRAEATKKLPRHSDQRLLSCFTEGLAPGSEALLGYVKFGRCCIDAVLDCPYSFRCGRSAI